MPLVELQGGAFQDSSGNVLDSGFLTMTLSHDEQDPATSTQIAAGLPVRIALDNAGNVATGQSVWATDVLLPAEAYYIVEAFRSDGTRAWESPQFETVPSGSSYNIGSWIPNQPVPQPLPQIVTFQTNGVNNGNQLLENLIAGTNITLSNSGGDTTISASSGATTISGTYGSGFWGPGVFLTPEMLGGTGLTPNEIVSPGGANEVRVYRFVLFGPWTIGHISMLNGVVRSTQTITYGIYSYPGTGTTATKVVDSGTFDAGGSITVPQTNSITPVTLPAGTYFFAQSATTTTCGAMGEGSNDTYLSELLAISQNTGTSFTSGIAAETTSAGVLPATINLSTVTPQDLSTQNGHNLPYFQP